MAKTTVTPIKLAWNTMSANLPVTAGEAINAANQMQIPYPREGKLLIILNNTFAGTKVFTIVAGDAAMIASGQGALDLSLAQNDVRFLVVGSDRFLQAGGFVEISFASSTTGFVQAFQIP